MTRRSLEELAAQVGAYPSDNTAEQEGSTKVLPRLLLLRSEQQSELDATLYEPVVCLILQGEKEVWLGEQRVLAGAGQSLIVSHDLPVVSRITKARPDAPYLALIVVLDLQMLRGLRDELGDELPSTEEARSLAVHDEHPAVTDCLSRYLATSDEPVERRVVAPLILKELHLRLLMAPHGSMLRQLLHEDSHANAISRAIARIRRDFRGPIKVPELARDIGMSTSTLHKYFKDITATTPLQYQKELRLLEARRLLSQGAHTVGDVAFEVGYESPNQFSREYSRKFGTSPRSHMP